MTSTLQVIVKNNVPTTQRKKDRRSRRSGVFTFHQALGKMNWDLLCLRNFAM